MSHDTTADRTTLDRAGDTRAIYRVPQNLREGDVINVIAGSSAGSTDTKEGITVMHVALGGTEWSEITEEEFDDCGGEKPEKGTTEEALWHAHNRNTSARVDTSRDDSIVYKFMAPDADRANEDGYVFNRLQYTDEGTKAIALAKGPRGALYHLEQTKGKVAMKSLRAKGGILGYVQEFTVPEEVADAARKGAKLAEQREQDRLTDGLRFVGGAGKSNLIAKLADDDTLAFVGSDGKGDAHISGTYTHRYRQNTYEHLAFEDDYEATVESGMKDALKETDRSTTHWGFDGDTYEWHFASDSTVVKTVLRKVLSDSELDSVSIPAELATEKIAGLSELIEDHEQTDGTQDEAEEMAEEVERDAPEPEDDPAALAEAGKSVSAPTVSKELAEDGATHISEFIDVAEDTGKDLDEVVETFAEEFGMYPVGDEGQRVHVTGTRFEDDDDDDDEDREMTCDFCDDEAVAYIGDEAMFEAADEMRACDDHAAGVDEGQVKYIDAADAPAEETEGEEDERVMMADGGRVRPMDEAERKVSLQSDAETATATGGTELPPDEVIGTAYDVYYRPLRTIHVYAGPRLRAEMEQRTEAHRPLCNQSSVEPGHGTYFNGYRCLANDADGEALTMPVSKMVETMDSSLNRDNASVCHLCKRELRRLAEEDPAVEPEGTTSPPSPGFGPASSGLPSVILYRIPDYYLAHRAQKRGVSGKTPPGGFRVTTHLVDGEPYRETVGNPDGGEVPTICGHTSIDVDLDGKADWYPEELDPADVPYSDDVEAMVEEKGLAEEWFCRECAASHRKRRNEETVPSRRVARIGIGHAPDEHLDHLNREE